MLPDSDIMEALQDEVATVMTAWKMKPGVWQLIGTAPAMQGSESRPILQIAAARYVVRRQPPDLTENDTRFRHAFMRQLLESGLPVPPLLPRPDGSTYGVVEEGIYELQGWLDGEEFVTDGPISDAQLEAAANMLGRLHQASAGFAWQPHYWPEERSGYGLSQAYTELIAQSADKEIWPERVRNGLRHLADTLRERTATAADALAVQPGPPMLHVHGDFQPHNLRFGPRELLAVFDFDASHYDQRVMELAYALLFFAGVRWDEDSGVTPPLVDDGMDILRAHAFLSAYGSEAPPAEDEARMLADALMLVFPVVFANGAAEDLVFPEDFEELVDEEDALSRLQWAESFPLWLDRYRDTLAQAWESGATRAS